jgi:hypothetical protein
MIKTGSELIRDIVGPAGSTKDGAFSRSAPAEEEDELWGDLLETVSEGACPLADTQKGPIDRQSAVATEKNKRQNKDGIWEP